VIGENRKRALAGGLGELHRIGGGQDRCRPVLGFGGRDVTTQGYGRSEPVPIAADVASLL
jgi:hypothetical protein